MSEPKSNKFQFCKDEKITKNFGGTDSEYCHIDEDEKYILTSQILKFRNLMYISHFYLQIIFLVSC